jgi:hypothetical protein
MHQSCIKTLPQQNRSQESPTNPIVGFLKIQLENHSLMICRLELVNDLMKSERAIKEASPLDEGHLCHRDCPMSNRSQMNSESLRDEFEQYIDQHNRAKEFD